MEILKRRRENEKFWRLRSEKKKKKEKKKGEQEHLS